MKWKPISSAPRTDVLIIVGRYNGRNQWIAEIWNGLTLAEEDRKRKAGFYKGSEHLDVDPDYWMPLPGGPKE